MKSFHNVHKAAYIHVNAEADIGINGQSACNKDSLESLYYSW